jgi:cytochrome b6
MLFTWFEERYEGQALVDDVVTKYVPPHVNLFYCFGGIVFMAFVIQFISGLMLTFYFIPTVDDAYLSIELLELSGHSGWLFRSVHRWTSNLVLLAILLHLSRVYLTGGFSRLASLVRFCQL